MENKNKEIDIIGILNMFWKNRKRLIINCFFCGVLSIIIAFSIPKEYSTTVVLAPEFSSPTSGLSGNLGTLASMAGVNLGVNGEEALYPELYPQIVSSTPFLCDLLSMPIDGLYKKETLHTNVYNYLKYYQREPWWSYIMSLPSKVIQKKHNDSSDTILLSNSIDNKNLTRRQQMIMKSLNNKISIDVDKGTSVITLIVTMQDPKVAADLAQSVSEKLQDYIGNYRTAKARKDLEQTERIYLEAQKKYYQAQQEYAEYCDQHQGVVKMKYQIEQDRLSNEQDLAYGVYNQIAQQLEISKAKLQEKTPVVVVMQPAVVPYKASSPKKMMIGLLFVFIAFFGTCAWLIIQDRLKTDLMQ